jgi:hypothetical protein
MHAFFRSLRVSITLEPMKRPTLLFFNLASAPTEGKNIFFTELNGITIPPDCIIPRELTSFLSSQGDNNFTFLKYC